MEHQAREFATPSSAWVEAGGTVRGIWEQVLFADHESGARTGLLRYEPGVDTSAIGVRVHDYWEEVLILDGDLTDLSLNQTFTRGMYALRPPGMVHGPWSTESGVLMLEIRRPAAP